MKKRPTSDEGKPSAQDQAHFTTEAREDRRSSEFWGTDNPRHLRALHALLTRPVPREQLDRAVGCSNGPDLIAELRCRGLKIPCDRALVIDRDGQEVRRGVYHLTVGDRRRVYAWLRRRGRGAA